jgi:hypothetical protein
MTMNERPLAQNDEAHHGFGRRLITEYRGDHEEEIPLAGYGALVGAYGVYTLLLAQVVRSSGVRLPERLSAADLALLGVATHKLTRLITKDWVTAPLRAPFTRYERDEGGGEVSESPRGTGLRRAIGALVTCPWCSAPWVAAPMIVGFIFAPRVTRLVAGVLATVAISDVLQHAYEATKQTH